MRIVEVKAGSMLRACRKFLAQDPVANVLPLGDVYSPLFSVSNVCAAIESRRVAGICSIYRGLAMPSIVFSTAASEVKQALVEKAINEVSSDFISLCSTDDECLFEKHAKIVSSHHEHQMTANPPRQISLENVKVERLRRDEFDLLNEFYSGRNAGAWTPLQLQAGPYYCVKNKGEIVSAAGVHLVTPQIAQLGNIFTDPNHVNQGFATACTSILASELASTGRIISLFVRTDNSPAIHLYRKLGFSKARDIVFLAMRRKDSAGTH